MPRICSLRKVDSDCSNCCKLANLGVESPLVRVCSVGHLRRPTRASLAAASLQLLETPHFPLAQVCAVGILGYPTYTTSVYASLCNAFSIENKTTVKNFSNKNFVNTLYIYCTCILMLVLRPLSSAQEILTVGVVALKNSRLPGGAVAKN